MDNEATPAYKPYVPEKYTVVATFDPKDRVLAGLTFEHLKKVCVFADHHPVMMTLGELKDKVDHVSPYDRMESIVLACDAHAVQYTRSMEHLWSSRDDFRAGWRAHERMVADAKAQEEREAEAKEAAKPRFAIYDPKYNEYAIIDDDNGNSFRATFYKEHATTWKSKVAAARAKNKHLSSRWEVVKVSAKS